MQDFKLSKEITISVVLLKKNFSSSKIAFFGLSDTNSRLLSVIFSTLITGASTKLSSSSYSSSNDLLDLGPFLLFLSELEVEAFISSTSVTMS